MKQFINSIKPQDKFIKSPGLTQLFFFFLIVVQICNKIFCSIGDHLRLQDKIHMKLLELTQTSFYDERLEAFTKYSLSQYLTVFNLKIIFSN